MAETIGVWKIFDGITIAASGTAVSEPVEMGTASALALFVDSIAGTALDVTFTYALGNTRDGAFVTPTAPVTIGANIAAADVLDFAPELGKYIKITATNNNAVNAVTELTGTLTVQENG